MAFKILTKNGIENTNIDGARSEYFNSGMRDGIVQGALNEGSFIASNNQIVFDTCELRIGGHRIIIDEAVTESFNPIDIATRFSFIAEVKVNDNQEVAFSLFTQKSDTPLIKDNLYKTQNGSGTYQVEIGRFTRNPDGTITNLVKIIDTITGGGGANGFEVGNVTTTKIDASLKAEVDIDKRIDPETKKEYVDFQFILPTDNSKALEKKADKTYVDEQLNLKSDKTYVDSALTLKADKTYVDSMIGNIESILSEV